MKTLKIVVVARSDDFHACLSDDSAIWGCGRTPAEAIGKMIMAHPEVLNLTIGYEKRENNHGMFRVG